MDTQTPGSRADAQCFLHLPSGREAEISNPSTTLLSSALEPSAGEARNRLPVPPWPWSRAGWIQGLEGRKMRRKAGHTRASSQASCLHWGQMTFCSLQYRAERDISPAKIPVGLHLSFARHQAHPVLAVGTASGWHKEEGALAWGHHMPSPPCPGRDFFTFLPSRSSCWLTPLLHHSWAVLHLGTQPPCHPLCLWLGSW